MVGDRLDTDILFGQNGGLTTMLCLSGTPPVGTPICLFRAACCCRGAWDC